MLINVEVSDVTLATILHDGDEGAPLTTLGDLVAAQVVERLRSDQEMWTNLRTRAREIRDDELRKAYAPLIAEALAAPVQRTNSFGDPVGEPTTMRELVILEVKRVVNEPADRRSGTRLTILEKAVRDQVGEAFGNEVRDEVARARDQVSGEIGTLVAEVVKTGMQRRV